MSLGTCSSCGSTAALSSLATLNGRAFCESCVGKATPDATPAGQSVQSNAACARCGARSVELIVVGKLPFCSSCRQLVAAWPFPQWLKLALACLLVLLAFALVHGQKYFHAGRVMYLGERLVEKRRYAEALPYLQEALKIAPRSDKAALLAAKAALLTGDMQSASSALQGHNSGHFEDSSKENFKEVSALWDRATRALNEAEQAAQLEQQDGKAVEAARLMHEAASTYPEMPGLVLAAEYYDEDVAFERRDYDSFLSIAEKQWKEHAGANTAAAMASALACKYAVIGDVSYRQRSEEMLAKALQMAHSDPEATKSLEEFVDRNKYRLESRQIITKAEYDRRFRSGKPAEH
jgi:tetratricopeptide (TPR) repeat protein